MNSPIIQLLVLVGIAVFLILRLRSVLGTRDGFEQDGKPSEIDQNRATTARDFEVIEGGPDRDITDHVEEESDSAKALAEMKRAEPSFNVGDFISGGGQAYEMILMAYENGDLSEVELFLDADIHDAFAEGIAAREDQGITIDASFIGLREAVIEEAVFNEDRSEAEITMKFVGELSSTVRDKGGDIIEDESSPIKKVRDHWTFSRQMGRDDPNWVLIATGS